LINSVIYYSVIYFICDDFFCYKDDDKRGRFSGEPEAIQPKKTIEDSLVENISLSIKVTTKELKEGHFDDDEDTIIRSAMEGHHHSDVVDEATLNELAKNLNRDKVLVRHRWQNLQKGKENAKRKDGEGQKVTYSKMRVVKRVGTYDEDEDEIIRRRIEANSSIVCKGFWDELAKELNREKRSLRHRWTVLRKGEMKKGHFDDDEDTIIRSAMEGHHPDVVDEAILNELAKNLNRDKVLVRRRWQNLRKGKENAKRKDGEGQKVTDSKVREVKRVGKYDEDEDEIIRRRIEANSGIGVWDELAKELNREKRSLRHRWTVLRKGGIKKGHFDDDEDTIICEKVKGLFYVVESTWDNLAILLNRGKKDVKARWAILTGEKTLKQRRRLNDKDDKLIRQILQGADIDIDIEEKLDEAALLLCRDKWAIRLRWQRICNMEEVIDKANDDDDNDNDDDDDNDDNDDDSDDDDNDDDNDADNDADNDDDDDEL